MSYGKFLPKPKRSFPSKGKQSIAWKFMPPWERWFSFEAKKREAYRMKIFLSILMPDMNCRAWQVLKERANEIPH